MCWIGFLFFSTISGFAAFGYAYGWKAGLGLCVYTGLMSIGFLFLDAQEAKR